MNAEHLLTHFDRIADAPDAIPRLRRFVLDLAIRGKLVPQDPSDEPGSKLLKRISAEKAERANGQKSLPNFWADELGDIPKNWCAVSLIALGQWAIGSGFPKNEQGQSEGPYFFLKVSDMNLPENDKYITTANNFIDGNAAKRMKAAIHPAGTIIFPKIGGAIATNKRRILTCGSAIDNNCLGITFSTHINIEWAYLLMTHLDFTQYQAGTAVPALQQGTLATIPVGLPPLAEQHRIVAKVDELMALCNCLEAARVEREATRDRMATASLARLNAPDPDPATFQNHAAFAFNNLTPLTTSPDQIKALRQTILTLAVRGKLVPQDPNDEPASELLKRIREWQIEAIAQKQIRAPRKSLKLIRHDESPYLCPNGWAWARLGEVIYIQSGDGLTVANMRGGDVPVFGGNGINGYHDIRNVDQPTIVIGRVGYYCGSIHVTPPKAWVTDNAFITYFCQDAINLRFLVLLLNGTNLKKDEHATAQPVISGSKIYPIIVGLPPLAEQHQIVAKVDELMTLCDRLEASLTTGDETRGRLVESTLHEALTQNGPC